VPDRLAGAFVFALGSGVVPRYRLIDEDGEDLGRLQAITRSWSPGDVIPRTRGGSLVVVNLTEAFDADDVDGYLVVRRSE